MIELSSRRPWLSGMTATVSGALNAMSEPTNWPSLSSGMIGPISGRLEGISKLERGGSSPSEAMEPDSGMTELVLKPAKRLSWYSGRS